MASPFGITYVDSVLHLDKADSGFANLTARFSLQQEVYVVAHHYQSNLKKPSLTSGETACTIRLFF